MTPQQGMAFVAEHGIVLQAARGPVPSLAEAIAGGPIRGSWWAHSKGHEIFRVADAVSDDANVLVCRLVEGKITYVHRRLWPALVKLAARFDARRLAKIWEEHTKTGAHRQHTLEFPKWVPKEVQKEAQRMTPADAERTLAPWLAIVEARTKRATKTTGTKSPRSTASKTTAVASPRRQGKNAPKKPRLRK